MIVEDLGAGVWMFARYPVGFSANTLRFYGELPVHDEACSRS